MKPLFISFYTLFTPYEGEAAQLRATLERHGLEFEIVAREGTGDWKRNTAIKPYVIRDCMLRHEGRPIVWLDADARVCAPPVLFDHLDCDVAAHYFHGHELLSSTVYFGGTAITWQLVQEWIRRIEAEPGVWDQVPLAEAIESMKDKLCVYRLPQSYAHIFDVKGSEDSVILQTQASRRLRKAVTP